MHVFGIFNLEKKKKRTKEHDVDSELGTSVLHLHWKIHKRKQSFTDLTAREQQEYSTANLFYLKYYQ